MRLFRGLHQLVTQLVVAVVVFSSTTHSFTAFTPSLTRLQQTAQRPSHLSHSDRRSLGSGLLKASEPRHDAATDATQPLQSLLRSVLLPFALVALASLPIDPVIGATRGEDVFNINCAACHAGGGNVIASARAGKTLKKGDLIGNKIYDVDKLYQVTYYGVANMPGFGESCNPKSRCTFGPRLTDEDVAAVAEYVLQEAERGWR
ncbi:unnamed protein product [Vitrella brassicaformis CCMP3155]|uniref:Cytochrome c-553 n=1 Tax=Vitrella brassicaformis (strain CCMP3155) TaxID=1169540 RepID=A0A0G4FNW8_VITBC|nr:unnamed protein product [Vitrella brassicaformis CCMP3155]|eukprot:CEM15918.1 unnamed protein product [Vitrella brassicaformis CCMP3155]